MKITRKMPKSGNMDLSNLHLTVAIAPSAAVIGHSTGEARPLIEPSSEFGVSASH